MPPQPIMPTEEDQQKRKQSQSEQPEPKSRGVSVGLLAVLAAVTLIGTVVLISATRGQGEGTPTPPLMSTSTHTLIPQIALALQGVNTNAEWIPYYIEETPGIMMALVPVGCFMMGTDEQEGAQPIHEQCFDQPFWIDVTEVTNAIYGSSGWFEGANRPRDSVNWFDARNFCESRGARLPTEREWEYAARGPDALVYPWGNDFVADNVVYSENAMDQTLDVGSRPGGRSWVGALDMSSNVWEWTSSLYMPYEYDATDGRESDENDAHAIRGGSWDYDSLDNLRVALRSSGIPPVAYNDLGFRCARDF